MQTGLTHDPNNSTALNELQVLEGLKSRYHEAIQLVKTHKRYTLGLTKIDQLIREMGSSCRELQLARLECLLEVGRLEECLNHSNSLMKLLASSGNSDIELLRIRGKCLYRMGDLENSVKHYQQALRCDPDNSSIRQEYKSIKEVDGCKERGNTAFKDGNYEEALQEWQRCIQLDPHNKLLNSKIYSNRANAFAKLRRSCIDQYSSLDLFSSSLDMKMLFENAIIPFNAIQIISRLSYEGLSLTMLLVQKKV